VKQQSSDYAIFENALKKILRVSHQEMKTKLDAEKQAKKPQQKRPSGHVSYEKD
jgi:hypothetical protein